MVDGAAGVSGRKVCRCFCFFEWLVVVRDFGWPVRKAVRGKAEAGFGAAAVQAENSPGFSMSKAHRQAQGVQKWHSKMAIIRSAFILGDCRID
jgi:hypothetical protein